MRGRDLVGSAVTSTLRGRIRTVLTVVAVFIGACALTLMDSPPLRTPSDGSFGHSFVHFEGPTAICHVVVVTAPSGC